MTIPQALQTALQYHQSGRLAEAETLYRQILAVQPHHADALHLQGVIADQRGRSDAAVDLIRQAIALQPHVAAYYCNLGEAYRKLGCLEEAIATYRRAIELEPGLADTPNNLGSAGALGKPLWVLSRFDACWRWLMERGDSPWYPTMRLFRQPRFLDWEPVLARLREQLALLAANHVRNDREPFMNTDPNGKCR